MKFKLMILSLSPLAFLTIIRNFLFVTKDSNNQGLNYKDFFKENLILIIVIFVCLIWIIAALIFYINFVAFKWNDKNGGYSVCNISENETASLNFFLTLIVPLCYRPDLSVHSQVFLFFRSFRLFLPADSLRVHSERNQKAKYR